MPIRHMMTRHATHDSSAKTASVRPARPGPVPTARKPSRKAPPPRTVGSVARLVARILGSLLGSWCFAMGFVSLGIMLLLPAGLSYQDAQTLMQMLGFLVLLLMFCWSYTVGSLWRLWLVSLGGGALMLGGASLLSRLAAAG